MARSQCPRFSKSLDRPRAFAAESKLPARPREREAERLGGARLFREGRRASGERRDLVHPARRERLRESEPSSWRRGGRRLHHRRDEPSRDGPHLDIVGPERRLRDGPRVRRQPVAALRRLGETT
jgi:hypothetical protein